MSKLLSSSSTFCERQAQIKSQNLDSNAFAKQLFLPESLYNVDDYLHQAWCKAKCEIKNGFVFFHKQLMHWKFFFNGEW